MINYKTFLDEMDAIKEKDGVDAAFGYVKGVVKTVGITSRLEDRITKVEIELDLMKPKTPKTPILQYMESKEKKQLEKKKTPSIIRRTSRTAAETNILILNTLKMHDHLSTKDLLKLTHIPYPTLIARLNGLAGEEKVVKTMRGLTKKRGYNWAIPERQKLEYIIKSGTTH